MNAVAELARVARAGDRAWLVDCPEGQSTSLSSALATGAMKDRIRDIVPAAVSVLVVAKSPSDMRELRDYLREVLSELPAARLSTSEPRLVTVPTVYDGLDLDAVASATGLTTKEVIDLHCSSEYTVAFFGFAPGFAYLTGLDTRLRLPRLSSPRPRVSGGSVAIANAQTCVYPGEMPSGWNQLGHSTIELWDVSATPPNLLQIGDRVRFEEVAK